MRKFSLLIIAILFIIIACNNEHSSEVNKINVLLPQTPSSMPVYLALKDNPVFDINFFLNHSQANAQFLRGDAKLLLTGISVANNFSNQGLEFDLISSQVDNLSHLVANKKIESIADIKGHTLVFPFSEAPMELLFTAVAEANQLIKGRDYEVKYQAFDTSLQLLQQGSDYLVWLPEPFATIAENKYGLTVSLSLDDLYQSFDSEGRASQVVLISQDLDIKTIAGINYLSKVYIDSLKNSPEKMLTQIGDEYPNRSVYTISTIKRTAFGFQEGKDLRSSLEKIFTLTNEENYLAKRILELN